MDVSQVTHTHHKPHSICIVCSINALADSHDFLIEIQPKIEQRYHDHYFTKANHSFESWQILSSSANESIHYLLIKLMDESPASFEAYVSITRNLIEKLSKLREVFKSEESALKSEHEFEATTSDVTMIFESFNPLLDSRKLKKEKFLDKGTDISNISEEKFQLIFTYLSRVIHSYNKDSLLRDKMTKFVIKSYLMVAVCTLYHQTLLENNKIKPDVQNLHSIALSAIEQFWSNRSATQKTLIYWTSFYDDTRSEKENQIIDEYHKYLDRSLDVFVKKGISVVPLFELIS